MASGTTYQALERLTHMPERSGEQGDRIAAQYYYNLYVTGGNLIGVTLTDVTINGETTAPNLRVVTTAGNITGLITDYYVIVNKASGQNTTYTLPSSPSTNQRVTVKDGKGDANTHNITVDGNGHTIDGGSSYVIGSPYGWNSVVWNGTEWSIIG